MCFCGEDPELLKSCVFRAVHSLAEPALFVFISLSFCVFRLRLVDRSLCITLYTTATFPCRLPLHHYLRSIYRIVLNQVHDTVH